MSRHEDFSDAKWRSDKGYLMEGNTWPVRDARTPLQMTLVAIAVRMILGVEDEDGF